MAELEFTDQELMAYADGELPETRASELDLALVANEHLSERLALFTQTRMQVFEAHKMLLDQPVPEHLVQHIRALGKASDEGAENVVPFRQPASKSTRPQRASWSMPLAASIALAIGLGAGLMLQDTPSTGALQIAALSDSQISEVLASLPAGQTRVLESGGQIELIASFHNNQNTLCREFEYAQASGTNVVAVACSAADGWDLTFAVASQAADSPGFVPASSMDALNAYLETIGAGGPLSHEDEAAALAAIR